MWAEDSGRGAELLLGGGNRIDNLLRVL